MVYRTGSGHASNDAAMHIRFRDTDGTWSDVDKTLAGASVTGFPMNPPSGNLNAGDAWLYITPSGRILIHIWRVDGGSWPATPKGTYQAYSDDNGATWSSPTGPIAWANLTAAQQLRTYSTDQEIVTEDTGRIYAGVRVYAQDAGTSAAVAIAYSDDEGGTWTVVTPPLVSASDLGGKGCQEYGLERIGADTFIAMIRDVAHTHSYKKVSTDRGLTWGSLIDMTPTVGIAARQRVYTVDHLHGNANYWLDTRLIMTGYVHTNPPSSQGRRNAIWLSQDSGATWSAPFYIDTTYTDAGYGDIFYDPLTGHYHVVSYRGPSLSVADLVEYELSITV